VTRVVSSIDIERPPSDVFGFLADLDNLPLWAVGLIEVRHDGRLRLGSTGVDVRMIGRRRTEMPWEVVELAPPHALAVSYREPLPALARFSIDPTATGTRLTCDTTFALKGAYRLMAPLIAKEARRTDAEQFRKVKKILEDPGNQGRRTHRVG
jgi:uncharacterized protein YndB with AHSA1/START domain